LFIENPIAELRAHGSLKMKFGQSHVKVLARLGARKPANCWERKFSLAAKLSPLPGLLVMAHFYPRLTPWSTLFHRAQLETRTKLM